MIEILSALERRQAIHKEEIPRQLRIKIVLAIQHWQPVTRIKTKQARSVGALYVQCIYEGGFIMTDKIPKKEKAISKKELVRLIIENNDRFDVGSLMRTNSENLKVILDLVK